MEDVNDSLNTEAIARYHAVGRRKEAVARVIIFAGKGNIMVNDVPFEKYFSRETDRIIAKQPLKATNTLNKYDVIVNVHGGGVSGQAAALRLGLARTLLLADSKSKDVLRKAGFLTRQSRMKERKKYGQKGARKRFQWTKR